MKTLKSQDNTLIIYIIY